MGNNDNDNNKYAVQMKNGWKAYKGVSVLQNCSISVERASIYGVIGASGCGKTTALSCLIGLRELDSGETRIFGTKRKTIPGRLVGYMPQDYAVYNYFTIREILKYFGRIYSLPLEEIRERTDFLLSFLHLPQGEQRLISSLSGGMKRRVSLAIAMVHKPLILVLDEPTVGLDPLLRISIWEHLRDLVEKQGVSILVTSHYIDEMRLANKIGVLRRGRLIAEGPPKKLLEEFNTQFLEQVFLKLCVQDEEERKKDPSPSDEYLRVPKVSILPGQGGQGEKIKGLSFKRGGKEVAAVSRSTPDLGPEREACDCFSDHANKIFALIFKTYLFLLRTPWFAVTLMLIPPFQMALFNSVLGSDPTEIGIGVVSKEVGTSLESCKNLSQSPHCFPDGISCRLLNSFPSNFDWALYPTETEALQAVQNGVTWGYLSIPDNYTQHLKDRSLQKQFISNETLAGSTIKGRLDLSYNLKSDFIRLKAYTSFQSFLKELATNCDTDPRTVELPLKFNAVYGKLDDTFLTFMQPGFFCLLIILLPMSCCLHVIQERKAGTLQRSVAAGLGYTHFLTALLLTEGLLLLIQEALSFFIILLGGISVKGSLFQVLLLVYLVGMVGMLIGFFVGQAVDQEHEAIFMILAAYLPMMVSSGVTWPFETMPKWALVIYSTFPTSLPIRSLRGIILRGFPLTHPQVYPGFLVPTAWIFALGGLSALVRRVRNK